MLVALIQCLVIALVTVWAVNALSGRLRDERDGDVRDALAREETRKGAILEESEVKARRRVPIQSD